jgi:hypothetical protein
MRKPKPGKVLGFAALCPKCDTEWETPDAWRFCPYDGAQLIKPEVDIWMGPNRDVVRKPVTA